MKTWYLILTECNNNYGTVRHIKGKRIDAFARRKRMRDSGIFAEEYAGARVMEWEPRYDGEWVEVGDRIRLDGLSECFPQGDEP